jgi:hypothetical protein
MTLVGKAEGKRPLKRQGVDERILSQLILNEKGFEVFTAVRMMMMTFGF